MSKWHSGPPPFPGWWNASVSENDRIWRWWNGSRWSIAVNECESASSAYFLSSKPEWESHFVKWSDYWPANARVPRIDPRMK